MQGCVSLETFKKIPMNFAKYEKLPKYIFFSPRGVNFASFAQIWQ